MSSTAISFAPPPTRTRSSNRNLRNQDSTIKVEPPTYHDRDDDDDDESSDGLDDDSLHQATDNGVYTSTSADAGTARARRLNPASGPARTSKVSHQTASPGRIKSGRSYIDMDADFQYTV